MNPYTIVLADDHMMFREGIKKVISDIEGVEIIGEASDGLELLNLLKTTQPHMIILDISMPRLRGLEATREIKRLYPRVKILLLTMHRKEEFIHQGLESGADGFLLKEGDISELVQAIEVIRAGKKFVSPRVSSELTDIALRKRPEESLTNREKQILQLLAEGQNNKQIAELLYISPYTVRRHRENIKRKLNLSSLVELVKFAIDKGYTVAKS